MATYKAIIAYDGTGFEGFQRLGPHRRTVQGAFEDSLRAIGWRGTSILAAGRTDAGVHARGQVLTFELDWRHEIGSLLLALNAHLPPDVGVREVEAVVAGFHPRFSALWRRYRYRVLPSPMRDPLAERFAWRVWPAPDLERMQQAAGRLVGEHDFGAFGAAPIPGGHTRREMRLAHWELEGQAQAFEIEGNAFLHHMVRRLIALMVQIGQGREQVTRMTELLDRPESPWTGKPAPARGLCLEAVIYGDGSFRRSAMRADGGSSGA
jgi:tRNA pseudouridine38-40 synthase